MWFFHYFFSQQVLISMFFLSASFLTLLLKILRRCKSWFSHHQHLGVLNFSVIVRAFRLSTRAPTMNAVANENDDDEKVFRTSSLTTMGRHLRCFFVKSNFFLLKNICGKLRREFLFFGGFIPHYLIFILLLLSIKLLD